jgi:type II secretory pathway component PulF
VSAPKHRGLSFAYRLAYRRVLQGIQEKYPFIVALPTMGDVIRRRATYEWFKAVEKTKREEYLAIKGEDICINP